MERILLTLALLLPVTAFAADDEEESTPTPESAPPADEGTPVPAPEPEPAPTSGPVTPRPVPAAETARSPSTDEGKAAASATDGGRKGAHRHDRRGSCARCASAYPRFQLWLGGGFTNVGDPGFTVFSGDDVLQGFQMGFELFPHERIAGAFSWSLTRPHHGRTDSDVWIPTEGRWGTVEASAKIIATPPHLFIRGYGRAGAGAWVGDIAIGEDGIERREERAAAGFALLGLGAEITSPRRVKERDIRFGGGLFLEVGARLGGGGAEKAAPSLDFGRLGRLDLGPWFYRAGAVMFF